MADPQLTPEQRARLEERLQDGSRWWQGMNAEDLRAALAHIDALATEVERLKDEVAAHEIAQGFTLNAKHVDPYVRAEARATAAEQRVAELERERDQARALYSTALEQAETYDEQAALTIRTEMARAEQAEARLREVEAEFAEWREANGATPPVVPGSFVRKLQQAEQTAAALTQTAETLRRLAKEATNGWACYAKRKIEHDEIYRLHQEIDAALHGQAGERE